MMRERKRKFKGQEVGPQVQHSANVHSHTCARGAIHCNRNYHLRHLCLIPAATSEHNVQPGADPRSAAIWQRVNPLLMIENENRASEYCSGFTKNIHIHFIYRTSHQRVSKNITPWAFRRMMDGRFASVKINKAKPNSYYENLSPRLWH